VDFPARSTNINRDSVEPSMQTSVPFRETASSIAPPPFTTTFSSTVTAGPVIANRLASNGTTDTAPSALPKRTTGGQVSRILTLDVEPRDLPVAQWIVAR
jgi:hypothetical protein